MKKSTGVIDAMITIRHLFLLVLVIACDRELLQLLILLLLRLFELQYSWRMENDRLQSFDFLFDIFQFVSEDGDDDGDGSMMNRAKEY